MKYSRFFTAGALALLFVTAAPGSVLADGHVEEELEELSLYFKADQLVEVATRSPKPLIQVAENVTIITADEIEAMNAHTLGEVLNRVAGIIADSSYTDFGASTLVLIQGSDYEHVLVLVDGIRWGYVGYYYSETNTIPVQIIKRIEIIRGAASSTWGSSLGGVVNIVTKDTGSVVKPTGTLSGSYGKNNSTDLRGDAAGRIGRVGYYLYGGYQDSDGLKDSRFFTNKSLYAKLDIDLPQDMQFGLTLGHSSPDYKYYSLADYDYEGLAEDDVFFATGYISAPLTDALAFNLSAYRFADKLSDIGQPISSGIPDYESESDGKAYGFSGRLVWEGNSQTVVFGAEFERRRNTDNTDGFYYDEDNDLWVPFAETNSYDEDILAFYINDTLRFDGLTVIPGLRYDRLSIADDQISPSLGLTYQLTRNTLLRGNFSRGFRKPYAPLKEGVHLDINPNPNLESEKINSFQLGVESVAIPYIKIKATAFLHKAKDVWAWNDLEEQYTNNGRFDRHGAEMELQTDTFYNFSMAVNGAVIRLRPEDRPDGTHYLANILLQYDDKTWRGQLFGHYVQLGNTSPPSTSEDKDDSIIWDLVIARRFPLKLDTTAELFLEAHNLFDNDQYFQDAFPNAGRWVEGGLRIKY